MASFSSRAKLGVTFDVALQFLRRGKQIRRIAWHRESRLFRLDDRVFVKLPDAFSKTPSEWKPYTDDILAHDWVVLRPVTSSSRAKPKVKK